MNCYEAIDLMGDAIEGSLAREARSGLEEHLEECAACHTYFEQLRLTCRALENLPAPEGGDSRRRADLIARFRSEFPKGR
jgi:anti-sigma factor RsiW